MQYLYRMKIVKDHFSAQANAYAKFRPGYSQDMINYICSLCNETSLAWDCGTGSGQLAIPLAEIFETVYATDISAKQLDQALQRDNIIYIEETAEATDFDDEMFDLITVAQAIHWFNFEKFYAEAKRTLRPDGIIAVIGYDLPVIDPATDLVVKKLYTEIAGPYWDTARTYIDEKYTTIPFPFNEIKAPAFNTEYEWDLAKLLGYLRTWSAVRSYKERKNADPVTLIEDELKAIVGDKKFKVSFPMLLRIGTRK